MTQEPFDGLLADIVWLGEAAARLAANGWPPWWGDVGTGGGPMTMRRLLLARRREMEARNGAKWLRSLSDVDAYRDA